jgi:hypothetical protein
MHAAIRPAAVAVSLLAGLAVLAGCASGGHGSPARHGTETLVFSTHQLTGNLDFTATASGVFKATGSFTQVGSSDQSRAVFPHGSFLVTHPRSAAAKVTSQSVNHATCVATETERVPYTISDGTGRYKRISGAGTAIVTFTARLPRLKNGSCDMSSTVSVVAGSATTTIRAVGRVRLP